MTPDKRDLTRSHSTGKNPAEKVQKSRCRSMQNVWVLASLWAVEILNQMARRVATRAKPTEESGKFRKGPEHMTWR